MMPSLYFVDFESRSALNYLHYLVRTSKAEICCKNWDSAYVALDLDQGAERTSRSTLLARVMQDDTFRMFQLPCLIKIIQIL